MASIRFLVILVGLFGANVHAHEFLPENNLWIGPEVRTFNLNGVDQQSFNQVLSEIETLFRPIVAQQGGQLRFVNNWNDGTVNARASRQGNVWLVEMFGGLARHDAMTPDGLAVVACHELGHHLGGAPRVTGQWASVEGQSDYFSTAKCLRKYFKGKHNRVGVEDPLARDYCSRIWANTDEIDLCVREVMGGVSSANLSHALSGGGAPPSLGTYDPARVNQVDQSHPRPQCRLDTYLRGALCKVSEDQLTVACTDSAGSRPACWFPNGGSGIPTPTPNPNPNPNPNPAPTPNGGANSPTLNGQVNLQHNNPDQNVVIQYDVRNFSGAAGVFLEISRPNQPLAGPNGINPDPQSLRKTNLRGAVGGMQLSPRRHLPGWGTYYIRVIPLDASGRRAVGKFSNSSTIKLAP